MFHPDGFGSITQIGAPRVLALLSGRTGWSRANRACSSRVAPAGCVDNPLGVGDPPLVRPGGAGHALLLGARGTDDLPVPWVLSRWEDGP